MGSRSTQVIGLNERAEELIAGEIEVIIKGEKIFPDGHREPYHEQRAEPTTTSEQIGEFSGMFGEDYPLFKHITADGKEYREAVQAEPWSSGPCIFLAFQDEQGQWVEASLWTDEEIEQSI